MEKLSGEEDLTTEEDSSSDGGSAAEEGMPYGRWPQRLLHVSSMTSYRWQPGNRYGSYVSPSYNTVSYTWGRYRLKDNELPEVTALPIKFDVDSKDTWEIPRIRPDRIAVDQFLDMIRLAVQVDDEKLGGVDFLWLDLACIDQRDNDDTQTEINRQALIFKNARTSYVWLHHLDTGAIEDAIMKLEQAGKGVTPTSDPKIHSELMNGWALRELPNVKTVIVVVFEDPWLSSLWTLQEAYLRRDAWLLPRDVSDKQRRLGDRSSGVKKLAQLTRGLAAVNNRINTCLGLGSGPREELRAIAEQIRKNGLVEILDNNPVGLYAASHFRTAWNPLDHVLGIMQIFGFRLSARSPTSEKYTLQELQSQMCEKLLERYPIESQLLVHTTQPPEGEAWRVDTSSILPRWALSVTSWSFASRGARTDPHPAAPLLLCNLSTREVSGVKWGYFEGKTCPLRILAELWQKIDYDPSPIEGYNSIRGNVSIALDLIPRESSTSSVHCIPGKEDFLVSGVNFHSDEIHPIIKSLVETDPHQSLHVLLLGSTPDPLRVSHDTWNGRYSRSIWNNVYRKKQDEWRIGLILRDQTGSSPRRWRRVGVCRWCVSDWPEEDIDIPQDVYEVLTGQNAVWVDSKGCFG
jgi:hypothetical protein